MRKKVVALLVTLVFLAGTGQTCDLTELCSDIAISFAGQLITEGVTLTWSTDAEPGSIDHYEIKRYNCSNPNTCSVGVATITPAGSCGTNHNYTYADYPPTPVSQWIYTVEVWGSTRSCAEDVVPH